MKMKYVLIIILIIFVVNICSAGSILSSKGVGLYYNFPNSRSMAMGGIAVALSDGFSISRSNPACLYPMSTTRISIQYFHEGNSYRDRSGAASSEYSNFDGFSFLVPISRYTGISIELAPVTRMDYLIAFDYVIDDEKYVKSVEGDGGLNRLSFNLYWSIRSNLAVGLTGSYMFGKLLETWRVDFENVFFTDTQDMYSTKNRGLGYTIGILYRPVNFIELGAVFSPKTHLKNTTDLFSLFRTNESEGSLDLPGYWSMGSTFHIRAFYFNLIPINEYL